MNGYTNPYSGETFFGFFLQLITRCFGFLSGQLGFGDLASDEIQILVLIGVAASAALVGSFLILRKMTMLANALSHTILVGIVLAFIWMGHDAHGGLNITAMLAASLIMGLVTTFLTDFLAKVVKLQKDASIGIVFTALFAIGIILVTVLTRDAHIGTEVVMGNVDALHADDIKLVFSILAINTLLFTLFFNRFKITTFDPALSRALGISTLFYSYLLMIQTSATAIGAFRAVGVLMVLAFLTGPPLTARLLTHDLKRMLLLAIALGSLASLIGVALSRHILSAYGTPLSTAGLVVCVITALFALSLAWHTFSRRQRLVQ